MQFQNMVLRLRLDLIVKTDMYVRQAGWKRAKNIIWILRKEWKRLG